MNSPTRYRSRSLSRNTHSRREARISSRSRVHREVRLPRAAASTTASLNVPSRNTIPSISLDVPSLAQLNQLEDGRQEINITETKSIQTDLKKFVLKFYAFEYFVMIVFFVSLIVTQIFKGTFEVTIIIFEIIVAVHLIVSLRNHFIYESAHERRENAYLILEDIFYIVFLFCLDNGAALTGGSNVAFIAITSIILVNQVAKTLYIYIENRDSDWKFICYLNFLVFVMKGLAIGQAIFVLIRSNKIVQISWILVCIPVFVIGVLLILHAVYMLGISLSAVARTIFENPTRKIWLGLAWMFFIPIVLCAGLVVSALYISNILDNSNKYRPQESPFLILFSGIVGVTFLLIFYTHLFEDSIITVMTCLGGLFDLKPSERQKIEALAKELREKEQQDYTPKFLIRISNVFFKVPTKKEEKELRNKKTQKNKINNESNDKPQEEAIKDKNDANSSEKKQTTQEKPAESLADLEKIENIKCVICFDGDQDAVYLPCGHGGVCFTCAEELLKAKGSCHLCRCSIKRLVQINPNESKNNQVKILSVTSMN